MHLPSTVYFTCEEKLLHCGYGQRSLNSVAVLTLSHSFVLQRDVYTMPFIRSFSLFALGALFVRNRHRGTDIRLQTNAKFYVALFTAFINI